MTFKFKSNEQVALKEMRVKALPQRPRLSVANETDEQVIAYLKDKVRNGSEAYLIAAEISTELVSMDRSGRCGRVTALAATTRGNELTLHSEIEIRSVKEAQDFTRRINLFFQELALRDIAKSASLLLKKCREFEEKGGPRRSLKFLYLVLDDKLKKQDHDYCDRVLARTDAFVDSPSFVLGVLTATAPLRERLKFFESLLDKFQLSLTDSGRDASKLLGRFRRTGN